ncbi:MAG: phosphotransferase [Xanthomonadaceae bacterium]|nr:phosphotransferase [Xanthomonadaceae bacterium]
MSVFTAVTEAELAGWLLACKAGALHAMRAVEGGVENTNYCIDTARGRFVLTLFEWQTADEAERTLALTATLADAGLPVARPWPQPGGWTAPLAGKPAALADWIDGSHPEVPTLNQCSEIGGFLGQCASVGAVLRTAIANPRDAAWRARTAAKLPPDPLRDAALADATALPVLPSGLIHADLFRDNALFDGDSLRGVIDFHYACTGPFLYDVAVAALDWCWAGDALDVGRLRALCGAYAAQREPEQAERAAFGALLQLAALRFWLSREHDALHPRPGRAVQVKDGGEMRARLAALHGSSQHWPDIG